MAEKLAIRKNEKFKAAISKELVTQAAWRQLQGFISYADGIIQRDGFEAIFNEDHPSHAKWKKNIVKQSLEYSNGLAVKSMPTEITGKDDGPIRLIYEAA